MPVICGSTTHSTATAATAASAAVPPSRKVSTAARVASGCDVAAMPLRAMTGERPGSWKSRAIRAHPANGERRSSLGFDLENLPALVHAGLQVDVVRTAQLARVLVLDVGRTLQRVGRTAHAAARRRGFSFRDSHFSLQASSEIRVSRAYRGWSAVIPALVLFACHYGTTRSVGPGMTGSHRTQAAVWGDRA